MKTFILALPVPMPPFVPLRRSTRDHHPSIRYSANEYVLLTDGGEPECYAEAMEDEHKKEWFVAHARMRKSLYENNTFELTKLPKGKRALKNKWVYKLKTEEYTPRPSREVGSIRVVLGFGVASFFEVRANGFARQLSFMVIWIKKSIWNNLMGFRLRGKRKTSCGRLSEESLEELAPIEARFAANLCYERLGGASKKQIHCIRIFPRLGVTRMLHISQEQYMEKVAAQSVPVQILGGGAVSWQSSIDKSVLAFLTTDAEYCSKATKRAKNYCG
ncbi:hypothetical protein Tco_0200790 [Tanacetum coccineum]